MITLIYIKISHVAVAPFGGNFQSLLRAISVTWPCECLLGALSQASSGESNGHHSSHLAGPHFLPSHISHGGRHIWGEAKACYFIVFQ